ncbi:leucine-rich repeat and guanylate kinase domain-containing protein-like [Lineus longissimus]|uniref:leucine-rich repeat and guanylate kinase domain-containing protein-like n=1 Tax=Lineus longissimus TaxID=88925 RepID=UPI00315C8F16
MEGLYDESHLLRGETNILNLDDEQIDELNPEDIGVDDPDLLDAPDHIPDSDEEDGDEDAELSPDGILDERTIARGISNLGRSADGTMQVYLHLKIPGYELKNMDILCDYVHLQKLEFPYNEVTDLSPLSNMPHLIEVDASHNKIKTLLDFVPPKNLKTVDFSYNQITEMTDLSAHHCLSSLILDHNEIEVISGLQNCKRLKTLSIAHNQIKSIQGLDDLPIVYLDLCYNQIKKVENLEKLHKIQHIVLMGNKIRSLEGLQDHAFLELINVEDNEVIDLAEIEFVKELPMLRFLNLMRNPIQELPDYRLSILFRLQKLVELDRKRVDVEEKVASVNMFSPPMEVVASRDHIMHVVYSFLQPSTVLECTLPSVQTPYPMLVLVGPQGSGKKDLTLKLVEEFPDYFGYGITHTTRKPHPNEQVDKDFHFVNIDEFEEEIRYGRFLYTYQYAGNWYGLTLDSVESIAKEGLACIVHMELEGVLTLKNTYFEPRYVYIMPITKEAHERRLRERGLYSEPQIETTLKRADVYAEYNQEHPGFFDMYINSDEITEAYKRLRRLVMDYLGINLPTPEPADPEENSDAPGSDPSATTPANNKPTSGSIAWSRASLPESITQQYPGTIKKPQMSPVPPLVQGIGVLEEASIKRRHSAAKEAVAGYVSPTLYPQMTSRVPPHTAPDPLVTTLSPTQKIHPKPTPPEPEGLKEQFPTSPDSSKENSRASTSLSQLSSLHRTTDLQSPVANGLSASNNLPTEMMDPIEMMTSGGNGMQQTEEEQALSRPGSVNRPGSERHKVLPPISPQQA